MYCTKYTIPCTYMYMYVHYVEVLSMLDSFPHPNLVHTLKLAIGRAFFVDLVTTKHTISFKTPHK